MTHQDESEAFERRTGLLILAICGAWLTPILQQRDELPATPGVGPVHRFPHWSMRTVLGWLLLGPAITIAAVWA
jgi:hypothetical protein